MSAASGSAAAVDKRIDELTAAASAKAALGDFGGDSWREGLTVLLRSALTEARFNALGEKMFYDSIVRALVNRLRIEDWYARHPEIDEQEVQVQLLGVGFPRTGSTALSHLLCEDPRFRNLLIWEETEPCPPPGVDPDADERRQRQARVAMEQRERFMPEKLLSMLPRSATGPLEDHDLMALEFKAQIFLVAGHLPSYADFFVHCDMEPTYRYEKRVLKLLQWKTPQKIWRLKSPTHSLFLDAYEKVFPEARFVQTHRDVDKVLPSVSDLYYTMLGALNDGIDPLYVGELNMEHWGLALDRMLAYRAQPRRDEKFFDIGFRAFQADPAGEIRRLYDWLGDEFTPELAGRIASWRADNPRDKFGRHEYDAALFGITDDALARRFAAYRERFGGLLG